MGKEEALLLASFYQGFAAEQYDGACYYRNIGLIDMFIAKQKEAARLYRYARYYMYRADGWEQEP